MRGMVSAVFMGVMVAVIVAGVLPASGRTARKSSGVADGPAQDSAGWTVFTPSADTRIVYVTPNGSSGCRAYNRSEIADPFNPPSSVSTCTLASGFTLIRSGYPDWLLFQRGSVWNDVNTISWYKTGRSATERMLIGSYGPPGITDRPKLNLRTGNNQRGIETNDGSFVAFTDLYIRYPASPAGDGTFCLAISYGESILIENMRLEGCANNANLHIHTQGQSMRNLVIRRNVFGLATDSPGTGRAMGIFGGADYSYNSVLYDALFEQNVFYRNGFGIPDPSGQLGNFFDHALYMSEGDNRNMVFRENLFLHNADGGKLDALNIVFDNNTYIKGAVGIGVRLERANAVIKNNVILDPISYTSPDETIGILLNPNTQNYQITGNIIAHNRFNSYFGGGNHMPGVLGINMDSASGLRFADNLIYNWCSPYTSGTAAIGWYGSQSNTVIENNEIQQNCDNFLMLRYSQGYGAGLIYRNNKYFSQRSNPFGGLSFSEWTSASGETGASFARVTHTNAYLDAATRMNYPFQSDAGYLAFETAAANQSKWTWDARLTAGNFNDYIRAGFDRPLVGSGGPSAACGIADFNHDNDYNILDYSAFQTAFNAGSSSADVNHDGHFNILDFMTFQNSFAACELR